MHEEKISMNEVKWKLNDGNMSFEMNNLGITRVNEVCNE